VAYTVESHGNGCVGRVSSPGVIERRSYWRHDVYWMMLAVVRCNLSKDDATAAAANLQLHRNIHNETECIVLFLYNVKLWGQGPTGHPGSWHVNSLHISHIIHHLFYTCLAAVMAIDPVFLWGCASGLLGLTKAGVVKWGTRGRWSSSRYANLNVRNSQIKKLIKHI